MIWIPDLESSDYAKKLYKRSKSIKDFNPLDFDKCSSLKYGTDENKEYKDGKKKL